MLLDPELSCALAPVGVAAITRPGGRDPGTVVGVPYRAGHVFVQG
ncbi:hypothetical protein [Streptomyces sp. NPDC059262]